MLVADCEAMLCKDPNIQNDSDDDDDDNLEGFDNAADNNIQREKPPGKISTHVPHAISVMSLNHNFEMQQYRTIWGTNVACELLDLIQEMIAYFHDKVKHLRNPIPVLSAQDKLNFKNATHCAYCKIDYSTIPKSMIHRHHDQYTALPNF